MAEPIWFVGGCLQRDPALAAAREAAVLAGRGVFETVLVREGAAVDLPAHLDRLAAGLEGCGWRKRVPPEALLTAVEELADACPEPLARLRLAVGDAGGGPEVVASAAAYTPPSGPVRVALGAGRVDAADAARRLKTLEWRRVALGLLDGNPDCYDVLVVNGRDRIVEGARTNVVVRLDGRPVTPPLSEGCLPGTVRRRLLESTAVHEAVVPLESVHSGVEMVLTNSLAGVVAVEYAGPVRLAQSGLRAELAAALETLP